MDAKVYPMCFVPRIYELWERANKSIPQGSRCETYCHDCMPSYQLRMKKLGRCEHPETQFTILDGGVCGVSG